MMSISITIDNLEDAVAARLEREARRRGTDVGTAAKQLLREALERASVEQPPTVHHDLDALAGSWSEEEANEFLSATADFSRIDEDLWK